MSRWTRIRALFRNFLLREIRTRYLGTSTGLAWALVHPLALLAVYNFVFTTVFRVGASSAFPSGSFLTFVAVGLWPWLATQEALSRATVSLGGYAGLIRKAAFPQETIVYASVTATFAIQFVGYAIVLVVLKALGEPLHLSGLAVAVPLWLVMMIAAVGVALALAALQVFMRDVEHVLVPVLMMFMYLTPILYPITLVPDGIRRYVQANPFGWLVTRMREALLEGRLGFAWIDVAMLAGAVMLLLGGLALFRRLSPHLEDFV